MPDLKALLERVEKSREPDRELDADLVEGLDLHPGRAAIRKPWIDQDGRSSPAWYTPNGAYWWHPPKFTASLDAVLALVEEKMPGANVKLLWTGGDWRPGYLATARVGASYSGRDDHENGQPNARGEGKTLALAMLAALLRALIAQQEKVRADA